MKRILIIGASGGIGSALGAAADGEVIGLSRSADGLDVTDAAAVARVLDGVDGVFDRIIIATGALGVPEKSMAAMDAVAMADVFAVNAIGPAMVLREVPRLLAPMGRVAVLSARVGSIGDNRIGGWHSYRASKAALNQIVRGAAIELARTHKGSVCVALHPGTVATPFTAKYAGRHRTVSAHEAAANMWCVIEELSLDQTGGFYDYAGEAIPW